MYYSEFSELKIIKDRIILKDKEKLDTLLQNKVVLVTGGAGSVGKKLCKKLLEFNIKKVIVIDINELSLYKMTNDFLNQINEEKIYLKLGSILDNVFLEYIFHLYVPDIVIHAAAYKHVLIADNNPSEVIKCNVQGTLNMLNMCRLFRVQYFVYLSSDKAVNPSSIMGATKRIGELLVKYFNLKAESNYSIIRFGNVFGSSGSVVPIFAEQIVSKKKVIITHSDMERYFMSLNDAVNLVMYSILLFKEGEIFICDMEQSIKIVDLAQKLICALGYKKHEIEIQYSNISKGESLYEELSYPYEILKRTFIDNIMICDSYHKEQECDRCLEKVYDLMHNLYSNDLVQYIRNIVPEYGVKDKISFTE